MHFFHRSVFARIREFATIVCTEVRFASFLSGAFNSMVAMNPPEKKLEKTHLCVVVRLFDFPACVSAFTKNINKHCDAVQQYCCDVNFCLCLENQKLIDFQFLCEKKLSYLRKHII